jgi:type VI secretion system protein ImpI
LSIGLRLAITNTESNTRVERVFARLPVRIGRNPLNDLNIIDRFISQFHAVLDLQGHTMLLRDLGSSNGTKVGTGRAPAHEVVDLARFDNTFSIGPLMFQARVENILTAPPPQKRTAHGLGEAAAVAVAAVDAAQDNYPNFADDREDSVLEDSAITSVLDKTLMFDNDKAAAARAVIAKFQAATGGGLGSTMLLDPNAVRAARSAPPPLDAAARERKLEQIALRGVREIAQVLVPNLGSVDDPEDLVRFLSKVRDTLEVFLRCFVPLREGYRQFATAMDIQREGPQGSEPPRFGERRVENARNEQELAECLLDFKNPAGEAQRDIEGSFADLMIHQLALLNAIMRGVKSLLHELSPQAVEGTTEELSKQGKSGFSWGPWKFKELWRVYAAKHGDIDDGDKRTFAALFGPDFAEAYKQFRGDTPESNDPPPMG